MRAADEESRPERRRAGDDAAKLSADARDAEADAREAMADKRSANADMRELIVDARGDEADSREVTADAREADADARDALADKRSANADMRELIGDARGVTADSREVTADAREADADAREAAAEVRESAADARDADARKPILDARSADTAREAGDVEERMGAPRLKWAVSDGCERLAQALSAFAAKRSLGDMRVVALPFYQGEAVVFAADRGRWQLVYDFFVDVLSHGNPDLFHIRVLEKQGGLSFAVVPLSEEGAEELAADLERDS